MTSLLWLLLPRLHGFRFTKTRGAAGQHITILSQMVRCHQNWCTAWGAAYAEMKTWSITDVIPAGITGKPECRNPPLLANHKLRLRGHVWARGPAEDEPMQHSCINVLLQLKPPTEEDTRRVHSLVLHLGRWNECKRDYLPILEE